MDVPGFALITGAGSGIGYACAIAFAKEGCAGIALLDLSAEALDKVSDDLQKLLPDNGRNMRERVLTCVCDVTDETRVTQVVEEAASHFGRIDYVVNAAGIAMGHEGGVAFAKTSDWQKVMQINLDGSFFVLRAASRIMLEQERIVSRIDGRPLQRGSIINVASIVGVVGVARWTAYTTSKHAVIGLTKSASEDYAKDGLRINAICPGFTETPMTMQDPDVRQTMETIVANSVPMLRMAKAQEIADGVLFLAGGRSSFVTGSTLMIDGGYSSR